MSRAVYYHMHHPAYLTNGGAIIANGCKIAMVAFDRRRKVWVATAVDADDKGKPAFVVKAKTQSEVMSQAEEAYLDWRASLYRRERIGPFEIAADDQPASDPA